jgi:hypothetical protein
MRSAKSGDFVAKSGDFGLLYKGIIRTSGLIS